uniref:Uncharacterized protein n=1 Tax=Cacopsylla melanoneura TaxID=428564 RepID=A0A8D9AG17_9HEMI
MNTCSFRSLIVTLVTDSLVFGLLLSLLIGNASSVATTQSNKDSILLYSKSAAVPELPTHLCHKQTPGDQACQNFKLEQAIRVCGKQVNGTDASGDKVKMFNYTKVKSTDCYNQACHIEVSCTDSRYHAAIDCHKMTHYVDVLCKCDVYLDAKY